MAKDKVENLEKKLKVLRKKPDKGATGRKKVDVLNELAYEFYASDPKKTEVYGKQALALAEKFGFKNGAARSYTVLGISRWVRGENDIALEYFFKSLKIFEEIGEKRGVADSYGNIGIIYWRRSDYEKALKYNFKALQVCEEIGYKRGIGNAYNNIGIIYDEQGDYDHSLKYKLKALKIYQEIGDKRVVATSLCNIGNIYFQQDDYNKALEYYFESLKNCDEIREILIIANCFDGIGGVYYKQSNYEKALAYNYKALQIFEEIEDKEGIARIWDNIAEIHCKQGEYENALEYQYKALEIFEEIGNKRGLANSYNNLAGVHIQLKHYESAFSCLQKGLHLAQAIEARDLEMGCYECFYELYQKKQDYAQALSYYKKYHDFEKEIFNATKSKQIAIMRIKYETEKKEKEAEIYHLKNVKLRKEIKERKKVEKELKKHRDHLEKLVEERTVQLRSLAHELSLVEEKQRRKIATYLHDDIAQALALATVRLELLQDMVPKKNIKKELEAIKEIIDQTTARTRSLTFEISPPVLYDLGFEPAVEWLAEQFSAKHGIECDFKNDGLPKPMSSDTKVILFQSIRELLTNIAKHAQARSVRVLTLREGNTIRIEVKDDGVGFNYKILNQKITKNEGFGLFNLRERLRHLRGKIEVSSTVGQGTSVAIMAPLKSSRRGANRKKRRG